MGMRGFGRDRQQPHASEGWREVPDEAEQPTWQDTVDEWLPPEQPDQPVEDADPLEAEDVPFEETDEPAPREIIATNRVIRLSCTLSAFLGFFALFLLFVEHESKAIRRFSLQSVALTALHLLAALVMSALGAATSSAPVVVASMNAFCWMVYLCVAVTCLILRIRLMAAAWQGFAFRIPLLGNWLETLG